MKGPATIKVYSGILKETIELFTDYTEEEIKWLMQSTLGMTKEEKEDYLIKIHAAKKTFPGARITEIKLADLPKEGPAPAAPKVPEKEEPPQAEQKSLWEL